MAVFGLVVAIAASGCGSGSSDSIDIQTGSLSKAEFIEKANAVCTTNQEKAGRELLNYMSKNNIRLSGSLPDAAAIGIFGAVVEPTYRREITQISELGAPEEDADKVIEMLEAIEAGLEKGRRDPAGAISRNELVPTAGQLARAYGLTKCGELWT